ncbi:ABC transporter substrate-binding protein [Deinococcus aestuarii]|uniref:ABC transporter substrate-binding protein n=1 Tax=Deinococcus aestuarii TaxID=2774531 RepID=UPI001C0DA521|nr:ABC transporter substrate-binding protein [Deinococcus aestuarii]
MRTLPGRATLLLASCLLASVSLSAQTPAPQRGGTLTYGRYADSLLLDPVFTDANLDIWILTNLYDTLIQTGPGGKGLRPGLASSYGFSGDGKTLTLTLRPGVTFSDGSPVTADDVKFSLDRARKPDNGAWNFLLGSIASVTARGNQVVLSLKNPDPSLTAALATFNSAIVPRKLYANAPGKTDAERARAVGERPVGSGPFVLSEWKRGSSMTLKRNPRYWQKGADGQPLPYLDAVRFEIIPDDNTRILKLQAGELQGAEFIPFSRVAELKANPKLNMQLFPSTRVTFVVLNNRPRLKDGSANPLANVKLRQALNYATDKKALIGLVTFGNGKPMGSYLSSATPLFSPQNTYTFDLNKAKQLFAASGAKPGLSLSLQVVAGNADQLALATALQQMWGQLGVQLKIEQLESATANGRYQANDFQMQMNYWNDDIADPNELTAYAAVYSSAESFHTGFQSKEVDSLFAQSQRETDPARRAALYKRIQNLYVNAAPMVFLYEQPFPVALAKNVRGFVQTPLGNNVFVNTYLAK